MVTAEPETMPQESVYDFREHNSNSIAREAYWRV